MFALCAVVPLMAIGTLGYVRDAGSGALEVRTANPAGGESLLVRRFAADFQPAGPLSVHGNRIAYPVQHGDSMDVMLTTGVSGEPRRLATFSRESDAVTWSWDGTRIAVADWLPGSPRRGGLWLFDFGQGAAAAPQVRRFDLGVENYCDQFQWTQDDSHIVMLCYGTAGRIMKLRLSDGSLSPVIPAEAPQAVWEYNLSPDGRQVVYPVLSDAGSAVFVLDLRPLLSSRR